jgi:uncharacterized membrane protein YbjE (DUF340 family)
MSLRELRKIVKLLELMRAIDIIWYVLVGFQIGWLTVGWLPWYTPIIVLCVFLTLIVIGWIVGRKQVAVGELTIEMKQNAEDTTSLQELKKRIDGLVRVLMRAADTVEEIKNDQY